MKSKFFFLLALATLLFFPVSLYSQENYPGAAVVEQEISNIRDINLKLQHMNAHKEKDRQVIDSVLIYLKSSLVNLEYLQDILKREKEAECLSVRHEASYHGGSKYAEVKCKRCGGTGNFFNPSTGETTRCKSCGGDGWAWTPSAAGHEKPCGNCKGSGTIIVDHQNQSCPVCNGTGWAHSKPNPPNGWFE
jgi:hypothetical protein